MQCFFKSATRKQLIPISTHN